MLISITVCHIITVFLVHCLFVITTIHGVPLSDFFDFGTDAGDTAITNTDSERTELNFQAPFPIGSKSYSKLIFTVDGLLVLDDSYTPSMLTSQAPLLHSNIPTQFPPVKTSQTTDTSVLTAFWSDVDTRGTGTVWSRRTTNDTAALSKVSKLAEANFKNITSCNFVAKDIVVVTWDHVGYFKNKADKVNTYQVVLATDFTSTFVLFLYLDDGINWVTSGQAVAAGISLNRNEHHYAIPESLSIGVAYVDEKSNVDVPGLFIFQINDVIEEPGDGCVATCQDKIKIVSCTMLARSQGSDNLPVSCQNVLQSCKAEVYLRRTGS